MPTGLLVAPLSILGLAIAFVAVVRRGRNNATNAAAEARALDTSAHR